MKSLKSICNWQLVICHLSLDISYQEDLPQGARLTFAPSCSSNEQDFMNRTNGIGFVVCSAVMGVLTGCTTYIQAPPTVYVPPPPVHVEPPRVSVAPPPVYVPPPANVQVMVEIRTENDFYEPLNPYGR